jgi:quercetin dioxygenase-like cupin family protein
MKFAKTASAIAALAFAAGCVHIEVEDSDVVHRSDDAMEAIMPAAPEDCPEGAVQAGAHTSGPSEGVGITEELMAMSALNGAFEGHVVRMRRIIIAPGGVVPWHSHDERQGMGWIVSGVFTEYANDCSVPVHRGPGSISREIAGLAHYWRNEGDEPVVLIATDVVPTP